VASNTTPHNVAPSKPKLENTVTASNNPFFGNKPLKKNTVSHIKDDFNPYKHGKVNDPSQTGTLEVSCYLIYATHVLNLGPIWPYHGKRYAQIFVTVSHPPPHPSHMGPPVQPPAPPPPYEEDPNAQAAARGYVYPYPPYGYPAQVRTFLFVCSLSLSSPLHMRYIISRFGLFFFCVPLLHSLPEMLTLLPFHFCCVVMVALRSSFGLFSP
jgi:hypothetical protein